jgi:hypothetical protein
MHIYSRHAYYLSNKDITISNRIYGIICPRINIRILAGKPARYRRVIADLKASRYIGERDTIINPTTGNLTITTKGQRLEIAETYRYPKRYQGRPREGRGRIPTRRGSAYGLIGRINRLETLGKV